MKSHVDDKAVLLRRGGLPTEVDKMLKVIITRHAQQFYGSTNLLLLIRDSRESSTAVLILSIQVVQCKRSLVH